MQRTHFRLIVSFCALTTATMLTAVACACSPSLKQQAHLAISTDLKQAEMATAALRAAGPDGLAALLEEYRPLIEKHDGQADWPRVKTAIDTVGGQYDCYTSQLYWYTDWDAAQAAAQQSGKPILELRLLGKLTDELSCANSRFFRSTLYATTEISQLLRDHFILYWQTVRPVPKVTIDFGDGRKLERTITGNSIHYILDSQGRPIDALPGVYGPQAFVRGLKEAESAIATMKAMNNEQRAAYRKHYHETKSNEIIATWRSDLKQLNLLNDSDAASADEQTLAKLTDDAVWARIAQLHATDAQLDAGTIALIHSQNPTAARAMPLAESKARVEDPLLRLVRNFQNTVALDSVRNEYTFHRQLHQWLAADTIAAAADVNHLNDGVYAELFLTPNNDPWLGLLTGYSGLDNDGVCQDTSLAKAAQ
jgi:hypothetical protein